MYLISLDVRIIIRAKRLVPVCLEKVAYPVSFRGFGEFASHSNTSSL